MSIGTAKTDFYSLLARVLDFLLAPDAGYYTPNYVNRDELINDVCRALTELEEL